MKAMKSKMEARGKVTAEVFGSDGVLKQRVITHNLITDVGDTYCAQVLRAAVSMGMADMKCGRKRKYISGHNSWRRYAKD